MKIHKKKDCTAVGPSSSANEKVKQLSAPTQQQALGSARKAK
jgi:hypothetical protein